MLQRVLHQAGDVAKGDFLPQEGRHSLLIGTVEHRAGRAPGTEAFSRQAQRREAHRVAGLKGQLPQGEQIQRRRAGRDALGIGHGVLDGQAHVRHAQLGNHRAVLKRHGGMHNTLGMHHHADFLRGHVEQPAGLHDFKGLVEHAGRVDGDLRAHTPVGVIESLPAGGPGDARCVPGAEGPAGGCK